MLGELIGGALSFLGAEKQQDASAQAALQQMEFQRTMSNSQYQRAVDDLKTAGLNPMLAYTKPASTPEGAKFEGVNKLGAGVSSAVSSMLVRADIDLKAAQAKQAEAAARDHDASAKAKGFPGAISDSAKRGYEAFEAGFPEIRGAITDGLEKYVPLGESSAQSVGRVIKDQFSVRDNFFLKNLRRVPEAVLNSIDNSAAGVKRRDELSRALIPPALGRERRGRMRGKLGGARSWDFEGGSNLSR